MEVDEDEAEEELEEGVTDTGCSVDVTICVIVGWPDSEGVSVCVKDVAGGVVDDGGSVVDVEDGSLVLEKIEEEDAAAIDDEDGGDEDDDNSNEDDDGTLEDSGVGVGVGVGVEVDGRETLLIADDEISLLAAGVGVGVVPAAGLEPASEVGELVVADGADVDVVGTSEPALVVLDIVNCLNTSLPGCLYIAMLAKRYPMLCYKSQNTIFEHRFHRTFKVIS